MKLRIYYNTQKGTITNITEPDRTQHKADLSVPNGINTMDMEFLKNYVGLEQEVEFYVDGKVEETSIIRVEKTKKGIWLFELK